MSANFSHSSGSSGQTDPSVHIPHYLRRLGKQMSRGYRSSIGQNGLNQPGGFIGNIYKNLFDQNGSEDFLGARNALQDSLSGEGLGRNIQLAYDQMKPEADRAFQNVSSGIRSNLGSAGLRFSTDLGNQIGRAGSDIQNNLLNQSLDAGLQEQQIRGQSAQNLFGQVGQLAQSDLQRMMNFATSFPSLGTHATNKGGSGFGFGGSIS